MVVITPRLRGFTLVEILVVIAIVGIMLTLIRVNLADDPQRVLQNETERIALLIEAARDEAITRGQPLAWSIEDGTLAFWQRDPEKRDQWIDLADADFRPRPLAIEIVGLKIANAAAALNSKLVLAPDGVQPAFQADFRAGQYRASVAGDVLGQIQRAALP